RSLSHVQRASSLAYRHESMRLARANRRNSTGPPCRGGGPERTNAGAAAIAGGAGATVGADCLGPMAKAHQIVSGRRSPAQGALRSPGASLTATEETPPMPKT